MTAGNDHIVVEAHRFAAEAAYELLQIDPRSSAEDARSHAVTAAIRIEDLLRALRGCLSGREIILQLLEEASPASVSSEELRHGSGIQEFARRIRELRAEGYEIHSTGCGYSLAGPRTEHDGER